MKTAKALFILLIILGLVLLSGLFVAPAAQADDTGWQSPSANQPDGNGDGFERHPTHAYNDGGSRAENRNNGGSALWFVWTTERHQYYHYNLNIPAGATIEGIEVRLDWWLDSDPGNNTISVDLSWDGGSSWTPAKIDGSEPTSETTVVLGSASDTWGRTWSPGEFSHANFRVRIHCYSSSIDQRDFYLDWVPVRVTYSVSASQVTIGKSVSPSTVDIPGQPVTYTTVISNAGPSNVHVQQITDTLPTGFSYVTTTATGGIPYPDSIITSGQDITWSYNPPCPSVAAGSNATLTFVATSSDNSGTYCNKAGVRWNSGTTAEDNLACVSIGGAIYEIQSRVEDFIIVARVRIVNGRPEILSWEIQP